MFSPFYELPNNDYPYNILKLFSSVSKLVSGFFFVLTPTPNELEVRFEALTASFWYIWAVHYRFLAHITHPAS